MILAHVTFLICITFITSTVQAQAAFGSSAARLGIPPFNSAVSVRIIDTTSFIHGIPLTIFVDPQIAGFTTLAAPAYSFLIEHASGRKLLFDLGVRTDPENLAPIMANTIAAQNWTVTAQKGVRQILEENGVNATDIEGIVWSHTHFDHTGDPSTFPSSTALIVGPNFTSTFVPAYPTNPNSPILESDYLGRELREILFNQDIHIGNFQAFDYFGDGSFYLLDAPGHAVAHLCGLARVTTKPNTYIFMGADAAHHPGEFRPSQYRAVPNSILPNPINRTSASPCPGEIFENLYRNSNHHIPFYGIATMGTVNGAQYNLKEAEGTIAKVQRFDADDKVLVVMAHDESLLDIIDFFPATANNFFAKGWAADGRWLFLKDFEGAL